MSANTKPETVKVIRKTNTSLLLLSPSSTPRKSKQPSTKKSSLTKILQTTIEKTTPLPSILNHFETISSVVKLKEVVSFDTNLSTVKYQVNFNGQYLSQKEWNLFSVLLLSVSPVVKLDLGGCNLLDSIIITIIEALKSHAKSSHSKRMYPLTELLLGGNQITNFGAKCIADYLELNTTLQKLNLRYNSISDIGAVHLSKAIAIHSGLLELDLSSNEFEIKGARALCYSFVLNKSLKKVIFIGNRLEHCGSLLNEFLMYSKKIETVNIWSSNLQTEDALQMAKALEICTTRVGRRVTLSLVELRLGNNNIGDKGAIAIAKALAQNKKIKVLDISANHLTDSSGYSLAQLLQLNSSLTELHLNENLFSIGSCTALVRSHHPSMQLLSLIQNAYISTSDCNQITEIIQRALVSDSSSFSKTSILLSPQSFEENEPIVNISHLNNLSIDQSVLGMSPIEKLQTIAEEEQQESELSLMNYVNIEDVEQQGASFLNQSTPSPNVKKHYHSKLLQAIDDVLSEQNIRLVSSRFNSVETSQVEEVHSQPNTTEKDATMLEELHIKPELEEPSLMLPKEQETSVLTSAVEIKESVNNEDEFDAMLKIIEKRRKEPKPNTSLTIRESTTVQLSHQPLLSSPRLQNAFKKRVEHAGTEDQIILQESTLFESILMHQSSPVLFNIICSNEQSKPKHLILEVSPNKLIIREQRKSILGKNFLKRAAVLFDLDLRYFSIVVNRNDKLIDLTAFNNQTKESIRLDFELEDKKLETDCLQLLQSLTNVNR